MFVCLCLYVSCTPSMSMSAKFVLQQTNSNVFPLSIKLTCLSLLLFIFNSWLIYRDEPCTNVLHPHLLFLSMTIVLLTYLPYLLTHSIMIRNIQLQQSVNQCKRTFELIFEHLVLVFVLYEYLICWG